MVQEEKKEIEKIVNNAEEISEELEEEISEEVDNEEEFIAKEIDTEEQVNKVSENKKNIPWKWINVGIGVCAFIGGVIVFKDRKRLTNIISDLVVKDEIKDNIIKSQETLIKSQEILIDELYTAASDGTRKGSSEAARVLSKKRFR